MNHLEIVPMALFALTTSITPGPVNVLSAMSGARFGVVKSLAYVFGATASFVFILLLSGFGWQTAGGVMRPDPTLMALVGGAYTLRLAWRMARDDASLSLAPASGRRPGLVAGLLTQGMNPKAWLVALSAISLHVAPHPRPETRLVIFSVVFFVICFLSLLVWVLLGARLARARANVVWFNRIMAFLLAVSVVLMLAELVGEDGSRMQP